MVPGRSLAYVTIFLSLSVQASAESCVMVADTKSVPTPTIIYDGGLFTLEPAFEDYSFMLFDACEAWEMTIEKGCDIYPMMGAIKWNALATVCDGNKVIVYDRRISPRIGYDGAQAVIAHELGHHLCNHLTVSKAASDESHDQELEADKFAGATLRMLGFSRESALSYLPLLMEQSTLSHPSRIKRKAALLAGWDDPGSGLECRSQ